MQPNHFGAKRDGFGEQLRVGRHGHVQAGTHEIGRETRGEGRMRHHGGEISHHVFGLDRLPESLCEMSKQRRPDVRLRRGSIAPERISTATTSVVVMLIGNQIRKR